MLIMFMNGSNSPSKITTNHGMIRNGSKTLRTYCVCQMG